MTNVLRTCGLLLCLGTVAFRQAPAGEVADIGSRLEPLMDRFLVEQFRGDAALRLHKPVPQEVVLVTDRPWEGNTCAYYTLFQDGDRYRMYYRGSHFDEKTRKAAHREVTCYAESCDGIHWTRPDLGLWEYEGSKQNNIVWDGVGTHDFTPFRDTNPVCAPEAKYKALARGSGKYPSGLYALQSPDGIHWKLMSEKPVITKGAFDSQNLAFWDELRACYCDYHRGFRDKVRDIMTCTSTDFVHWGEPAFLEYSGTPREHLYTNAIRPYPRAPHILIGFPTRYLPKEAERVEPTFMTSRDGRNFQRWPEAVIPPTAPEDRTGNRSNYMTWGLLQLPGAEKEYSVYATEAYYRGPCSRLRRFTYRLDGFVSAQAGARGGELLTRPLRFAGDRLVINFATAPQGQVRVEIQDADGKPLDGFRAGDCPIIRGDALEHTIAWQRGSDLGPLSGKTVRLRFELRDADLFSLRFAPAKPADVPRAATLPPAPVAFRVQLDTISSGFDGKTCWVHPRAGAIPGDPPRVILTMQKLLLSGSDVFFALNEMRTDDLGKTWSGPVEHADTLGRRDEPDGVVVGACDFWPKWHAKSGKLLGIGHTVRYRGNKVIADRRRETCYSVYDEKARTWTPWTTLDMPDAEKFYNAGAGCVQRVDLPNGDILLPIYFKGRGQKFSRVTVLHCAFDGRKLTMIEQGNELSVDSARGLGEPSLTRFHGRFYLTLRHDQAGYVCRSPDGLHFDEPRPWQWDDGGALGNYNTQQHWVTHDDGLLLVYTRRGADNDYVFRHRAPLFIAQIDPQRLCVVRTSERILVPNRGARLGNFGVTEVNSRETWVTVAEWMQTTGPNPSDHTIPMKYGSNNAVFAARILWAKPNRDPAAP